MRRYINRYISRYIRRYIRRYNKRYNKTYNFFRCNGPRCSDFHRSIHGWLCKVHLAAEALWAGGPTEATFSRCWMIAKNSEYDSFGHVHFDAVLQRNDCTTRAVKIIKALIYSGVKKQATRSGKCDSAFQLCIFGCNTYWWECA